MDPLVVMVIVVIGGTLCLALLASTSDRRVGTRLLRIRPRRDQIAEGSIKQGDVDQALEHENERRKDRGLRELGRAEFESIVVADARTRRKVWLWKGRR